MSRRILLAGESWVSTASHIKGFDQFATATYHTGADRFVGLLEGAGHRVDWIKAHEVPDGFPTEAAALAAYDVVILSDIGTNALLLSTETWLHSRPTPNRLKLLRQYVRDGGGLLMVGGYYSFQGINGGARYRGTAVEDVLPVTMHPVDDRIEVPEGCRPIAAEGAGSHPVLSGIDVGGAPPLLGLNEVLARPEARTLLSTETDEGVSHPLLVVGTAGRGRSAAWTSDIGPHWMPEAFLSWPGTARLFDQLVTWLAEPR